MCSSAVRALGNQNKLAGSGANKPNIIVSGSSIGRFEVTTDVRRFGAQSEQVTYTIARQTKFNAELTNLEVLKYL
jgi:hypothetical protein